MAKQDKVCSECQKMPEEMFRIWPNPQKEWIFVCKSCLLHLKAGNPNYRYGGTWKRNKRR